MAGILQSDNDSAVTRIFASMDFQGFKTDPRAFDYTRRTELFPIDAALEQHPYELKHTNGDEQPRKEPDPVLYVYFPLAIWSVCLQLLGSFLWGNYGNRQWLGLGLLSIGAIGLASALGGYAFGSIGAFWRLGWL